MKVSLNWIKKYIDIDDVAPNELADRLTFAGVEVEAVTKLSTATKLVIGEVIECGPHPDSDHLSLTKVNTGHKYGILQIVCGAPNVANRQKVIVALDGAVLPGGKISKGLIRGVESQGMICSMLELGVDAKFLSNEQTEGIEVLADDAVVGNENVLEYLGLDDIILDLKLLANRSDLHSIANVAREISTLYQREVRLPRPNQVNAGKSSFKVFSETPSCPQFSGRVIRNIKVEPSPKWLQQALQSMGVRSINNIVDIGNYVMLLTGQPLHMYDLDKLPKPELIIKDDYVGTFVALDEKEYTVQKGDIAITSGNQVMCLGGIMGSLASAVTEKTKNIVIEVANFAFDAIRRTSTRLALVSDSSSRFAKGINPYQYDEVVGLATDLIVSLCHTEDVLETITYDARKTKRPPVINTSVSYINNRLGTHFMQSEIVETLRRDWMTVEILNRDDLRIEVPTWRIDIGGEADISEEVIRILGLDKIANTLPSLQVTVGGYPKDKKITNVIRGYLKDKGVSEILTYTLVKKDELDGFTFLTKGESYRLINPLTDEHEYTRLSLIPSMLKVASYNIARGNKNLAFYEVSDIDTTSEATTRLGLVLTGDDLYHHHLKEFPYSFYHLKGFVEAIMSLLGIKESRFSFEKLVGDQQELHPGRSALLKVNGKVAGYLGELHPSAISRYNLGKNNVLAMELELPILLSLENGQTTFKSFSRFPSVQRDLSLVSDKNIAAQQIIKAIVSVDRTIKKADIFDIYSGEGIEKGYQSIAMTITYERDDRTLKDEEVNAIEKAVLETLNKKLGIVLRT